MSVVPLLLVLSTTIFAMDDTTLKVLRNKEVEQRSIAYSAQETAKKASDLTDEITYNNILNVPKDDLIKTSAQLNSLIDIASIDGTIKSAENKFKQAIRNEDLSKVASANKDQEIVVDKLKTLMELYKNMEDGGESRIESLITDQQNIINETKELEDKMLGKNKEDLSSDEKLALEKVTNDQNSLNSDMNDLSNDMNKQSNDNNTDKDAQNNKDPLSDAKQNSKQASDAISENKLAEANKKQEETLKNLQDVLEKIKSKNKENGEKSENPMPGEKPGDKPSDKPPQPNSKESGIPGEKSELQKDELIKVNGSNWTVTLNASDREILHNVKSESFPKQYEKTLIQYYQILARMN